MSKNLQKGFAPVALLIILGAILVVAAMKNGPQLIKTTSPQVLGEDSGGGHDGSDSKSGSSSQSNSDNHNSPTPSPSANPPKQENHTEKEDSKPEPRVSNAPKKDDKEQEAPEATAEASSKHETENESEPEIETEGNDHFFSASGSAVQSHFPLEINPETRALTVTTPTGTKIVAILPDQAIENLLRVFAEKGLETHIASSSSPLASGSANLVGNIEEHEGQITYKFSVEHDKKIFGILPVAIPETVFVSTQNGQIVDQQQSFVSKILSVVSS